VTAQVHASGLRRNPTWLRALTAFLVTRLGDLVFDLTVVLWITTDLARGESWAPAAVSGVLVAAVVPTLAFGPLAGVHADRHDRRRMMLRANLLQALFIGSLLVTPVLVGHVSDALVLVWVYVAVFVTNAAGQYFNQGRLALVAVSVPTEDRTAAFGMQGVAVNLLSIIGPPLAAPLLFSVGVYPALALNAVSFVLSSAILSRIAWDDTGHSSSGPAGSFWSSLAEGATAVSSNRVLSTSSTCTSRHLRHGWRDDRPTPHRPSLRTWAHVPTARHEAEEATGRSRRLEGFADVHEGRRGRLIIPLCRRSRGSVCAECGPCADADREECRRRRGVP